MGLLAAAADYLPFVPRPAPRFVTEGGRRVYGVLAEFSDPAAVYHAAEAVRDAGYKRWDVHSPYPVHGIEEAMGIRRTILPLFCFGAAMTGVLGALAMQYYMNHFDYQFIVQGKDTLAWEAYIPITFELGVLLTAFTALFGMLMLNGLPRWNHPVFNSERFLGASDDRLIIAIEADDKAFDPVATRELLERAGATHIELIEDDE
jgi:hypothetical protein